MTWKIQLLALDALFYWNAAPMCIKKLIFMRLDSWRNIELFLASTETRFITKPKYMLLEWAVHLAFFLCLWPYKSLDCCVYFTATIECLVNANLVCSVHPLICVFRLVLI